GREYKNYLAKNKNNLFYSSMEKVYQKLNLKMPEFKIDMEINIPLSRGLGSSSSAIVAGVFAANHFLNNQLTKAEMLNIANQIEGHPDNVSPCLMGGAIISMSENNQVYTQTIAIKNKFDFIAVIPDFELSTKEARKVLPAKIDFADSIFNSSRLAFLITSLMSGDNQLTSIALKDKLHEQYRGKLIKGFEEVKSAAIDNGAIGSVLSGAGPTIMVLAENNAQQIAEKMQEKWLTFGIKSRYEILSVDYQGCKIKD
ncbi:MAG: homoserine kinase, partial [Pedobacter sp.]